MIGVLSDAHGNLAAFGEAVRLLSGLGADRLIYLGDAVGYIDSLEVVSALMRMGERARCVRGNHEEMILDGPIDPAKDAVVRLEAARTRIKSDHREFLSRWPTHLSERYGGASALFVHGSPRDFTGGYLYPQTDLSAIDVAEDFVFMGHTHHPFVGRNGHTTFVNVGSVGLPRDDGRYGSFATFDPERSQVAIYRFSLAGSMEWIAAKGIRFHPSVEALFRRRTTDLIGKVIE